MPLGRIGACGLGSGWLMRFSSVRVEVEPDLDMVASGACVGLSQAEIKDPSRGRVDRLQSKIPTDFLRQGLGKHYANLERLRTWT